MGASGEVWCDVKKLAPGGERKRVSRKGSSAGTSLSLPWGTLTAPAGELHMPGGHFSCLGPYPLCRGFGSLVVGTECTFLSPLDNIRAARHQLPFG
jgi:hypothetical protein